MESVDRWRTNISYWSCPCTLWNISFRVLQQLWKYENYKSIVDIRWLCPIYSVKKKRRHIFVYSILFLTFQSNRSFRHRHILCRFSLVSKAIWVSHVILPITSRSKINLIFVTLILRVLTTSANVRNRA